MFTSYGARPLAPHTLLLLVCLFNIFDGLYTTFLMGEIQARVVEQAGAAEPQVQAEVVHGVLHVEEVSHLVLWAGLLILCLLFYPLRLERDEAQGEYRYVFTGFALRVRFEHVLGLRVLNPLPCGLFSYLRIETKLFPLALYVSLVGGAGAFIEDWERSPDKQESPPSRGYGTTQVPSEAASAVAFHSGGGASSSGGASRRRGEREEQRGREQLVDGVDQQAQEEGTLSTATAPLVRPAGRDSDHSDDDDDDDGPTNSNATVRFALDSTTMHTYTMHSNTTVLH